MRIPHFVQLKGRINRLNLALLFEILVRMILSDQDTSLIDTWAVKNFVMKLLKFSPPHQTKIARKSDFMLNI